jgi:hypothetical protein
MLYYLFYLIYKNSFKTQIKLSFKNKLKIIFINPNIYIQDIM